MPTKLRKGESDSLIGTRMSKSPTVAMAGNPPVSPPQRGLRPTLSLTRTHIPRAAGHGKLAGPYPDAGPGPPGAASPPGRAPACLNAAAAALSSRTFFPRTSSLTYSVEDASTGCRGAAQRGGTGGGDRADRSSTSDFSDVFSISNPNSFTMDPGFATYDNTLYRDII